MYALIVLKMPQTTFTHAWNEKMAQARLIMKRLQLGDDREHQHIVSALAMGESIQSANRKKVFKTSFQNVKLSELTILDNSKVLCCYFVIVTALIIDTWL